MDILKLDLVSAVGSIPYVAVIFALVLLAKYGFDYWFSSEAATTSDFEIEEASNLAVGIRRTGIYLGIPIGLLGTLMGESHGLWMDIMLIAQEGVLVMLFIFIASVISDKAILPNIANTDEVLSDNTAVACVEFGLYVATGLIAYGSFIGEGGGLVSALVFFGLGQLALIFCTKVYEAVTPYEVVEMISGGNTSAGVLLGGVITAIGLIIHSSISGPFVSWTIDIISFAAFALLGLLLLLVMQKCADWLFLPNTTIQTETQRDNNVSAMLVTVALLNAFAIVLVVGVV